MIAPAADGYIHLDARQNFDSSFDVLVGGYPVPGGEGLAGPALAALLVEYARGNGVLLVTTTLPDGTQTTDVVSPDGTVSPYYPPEAPAPVFGQLREAAPDPELLFAALSGRIPLGHDQPAAQPRVAPVQPRKPAFLTAGPIPEVDIEGDMARALAEQRPVRSRGAVLAAGAAVAVLVAVGVLMLLLPHLH